MAITREYRPKLMATGLAACYCSTSDYSSLVDKWSRQFPTVSSKAAVNRVRLVHSKKTLNEKLSQHADIMLSLTGDI